MLPPVFLLASLVVIIVTALVGLLRGFKRFFPSLIVIAGSLAAAFVATLILKAAVGEAVGKYIHELIDNMLETGTLDSMPTAAGFVEVLPSALAAPFIFAVCYAVILAVAEIIRAIVTAVSRKKTAQSIVIEDAASEQKKSVGSNKLLGLGAGVLGGLIAAFAMFMPFIGYFGTLSAQIDHLNEVAPEAMDTALEDQQTKKVYSNYIEPMLNDPYVKLSYAVGGKAVFNAVSSVKVDGEKYPFSKFISTGLTMYGHTTPLFGEKLADYDQKQIDAINNLVEDLDGDELLTNICAEFLASLASSWEKGEAFFGIEPIVVKGDFAPVFDKLVSTFATSNSQNISADLHSAAGIVATVIKYHAIDILEKEDGDFKKVLSEPGFVSEFCTVMQKNERMEHVFFEVAKLGVVFTADAVGIPEEASAGQADRVTRGEIIDQLHEVLPADAENESHKFEIVVTSVVSIINSLEGDSEKQIFDIDSQAVEDIIVTMSDTKTFGDATPLLLKGICQSDMIADAGFSGDNIYNDITAGGYNNIANILDTVKHAAKMMNTLSASGAGSEGANVEEEIEWLVTNMTPETSAIISNQITEDTLKNYGVSEESAAPVSDLISNMFTSMSNESRMSEEEYKAESEAISHLFTVATELNGAGAGEAVFDDKVSSAQDITETVLSSKVVSDALINTAYDENGELKTDPLATNVHLSQDDKAALTDALNSYSTNNLPTAQDADKEMQKISALASIFNLDIEIAADGTVTSK